ncbi:MAG TPA: MotA/TolQ/ExbB proton channel family protein [Syntrophorhabdaceae bacterium]|nr:MotA/TolQ/ExbB proton channel family protein [Syntrophorhabdaceae bacterium]HPU29213.1 MotA/TolQ/ExbB proton channel family protein [Syntrophorhabdaceae bacterium]
MIDIIIKGGWMMVPLAICSIISVTIIFERFMFFKRMGVAHQAEEVLAFIGKGQVEKAITLANGSSLPIMRVLSAGLNNPFNPGSSMVAAATTEIQTMKRGLTTLDTIITLAPLLGLLGTIIGMIRSFKIMALAGIGQPHAVTGGVAEALIATAAGITIAIITLIPYNYFLARIERETEVIETFATRLEMALRGVFKE